MWKINKPNRNQNGHTLLFILLTLLIVMAFTFMTVNQGMKNRQWMRLQLAADAAAISGSIWEARTYNLLAAMNQGILIALTAAFTAAIILVALIACAATIVGAPVCAQVLGTVYKPLINIILNAHEIAVELSDWERKIIQVAPLFPLGYAPLIAQKNHAQVSFPFPFIPESLGGDHDDKSTLSLHTEEGGYEAVAEKALKGLFKDIPESLRKFSQEAMQYLDALVQEFPHPDPLVLDSDFRERQKLGVVAFKSYPGEPLGLISLSQATVFLPGVPYGEEDLFEMNWHVKLTPVDFHKDLPEKMSPLIKRIVLFD